MLFQTGSSRRKAASADLGVGHQIPAVDPGKRYPIPPRRSTPPERSTSPWNKLKNQLKGNVDRRFVYEQLAPHQIRLVRVRHDFFRSRLRGEFINASLDNLPKYQAISYCWGDGGATERIWFGDHEYLQVTKSAVAVLGTVIDSGSKDHVWIDALCIDQENAAEKNSQVQLMGLIYSSAASTLGWLGEAADDSDRAISFLKTLRDEMEKYDIRKLNPLHKQAELAKFPSFKETNTPDWIALQKLLQRPWFTRIWIIQEMVLSVNCVVMCGRKTIKYDVLISVIWTLASRGLINFTHIRPKDPRDFAQFQPPKGVEGIMATFSIAKHREARIPHSLQELLLFCRGFEATDDRDIIFALLGIASESGNHVLTPDYGSSVEEVFTKWTRDLMISDNLLTLLHAAGVGNPRVLNKLPSWVPDLTARSETIDSKATVFGQKAFAGLYQAGGAFEVSIRSDGENRLIVRGEIIDTVKYVAPPRPAVRDHEEVSIMRPDRILRNKWAQDTMALIRSLLPYPTGESFHDVYWRTLIANMSLDMTIPPPGFFDNFDRYIEWDELAVDCKSRDEAREIGEAAGITLEDRVKHSKFDFSIPHVGNRVLFTTSFGYAGLGPPECETGDLICIVHGAAAPFLLHKSTEVPFEDKSAESQEDQTYVLVGECYIHGLMNGEGMVVGQAQDIILV